ncbi:unnamed protein product [Tilletia laevis]|uniref:Major facilitator superfamily (MFS) profile domain-containing protein n=2 Tax=Tilletia TaxID=13289 RepID=A0A8T8SUM6_9BASI|nr:hypothetical protein CF335_g7473 [Tilletia laevis]KAE8204412.1 hypothetical protein CF328_g1100 [Tilletia controversa]KAE8246857.1 hypothetical protein A4X03_0g7201 [Tilletia caries]KAE8196793.1 hypothetical protein CF336_g2463 [Tilletia laevis]CAD6884567.1 unnamed protein product [Tilletia caries]
MAGAELEPSSGRDSLKGGFDSPVEASEDGASYTREEEKKLMRKVDFMIVPIFTLMYLLSFLDRTNIGAAKIEGLVQAIGIKDYNNILTIFFVGYVIAEVPANIILKRTSPPLWLPSLTLVWGIVATLHGVVKNERSFYAVRFFLGITESGLFPGICYVYSMFYKRNERHYRISLMFSGAAVAGAFGGLLAYGLGRMNGIAGKRGFEWIFIIEGLITIVVSLIAYFLVPNYPAKSKRFTAREKEILNARLASDSDALDEEPFSWSAVGSAAKDPFVWGYCFLFHTFAFVLYSISLFIPTLIKDLGRWTVWQSQLLSVPPYALAFIVTMTTAHFSFVYRVRGPFIIGAGLLAIVGYIVLMTSPTVGGKYAALFLIVSGVYAANALLLSWPAENVSGQTKRAVALGMQISIGNLGSIVGTQLYRVPLGSLKNKNYIVSHGFAIGYIVAGITIAGALSYFLRKENQRRDALAAAGHNEYATHQEKSLAGEVDETRLAELRSLGDRRPNYRYRW